MMSKEELDNKLKLLEMSTSVQTAISKAVARSLFRITNEPKDNYAYLSVDDNLTNHIGIEYIDLGCKFFLIEDYPTSSYCFTKGAECLESIHTFEEDTVMFRKYYGLIASMAFYAGFQYSRAFILINKFEEDTPLASLVSLFVKRSFEELTDTVENMVVDHDYKESGLIESDDIDRSIEKIFEINIAKSLYCFVQYYYTGDENLLSKAKEKLDILLSMAETERLVALWWVVRLLVIILDGFRRSSLWTLVGNYHDVQSPDSLARKYVLSLIYRNPPITDLFISQRAVLPQIFNPDTKGIVVSIPTSSGKTRIAELAILDSLIRNPERKILYVAPFRSLAYEIENSLGTLFATAQVRVSHLYGGSLFTSLDVEELSDAHVVIATPEKTKAIFRCQKDFFQSLSLVVMDEGHLLGGDNRQIGNEIFYEELKHYLKDYFCKYLLLSAVLPNTSDLSQWLTGSDSNVYNHDWRPSKQICGILNWNGKNVDLEWYKDKKVSTFNRNFITRKELPRKPRQRTPHYYPSSKIESVVETAKKLETFGSTLIFVPQKRSCNTVAEAYSKAIQNEPLFTFHNTLNKRIFELVCKETYSSPKIYEYALQGILYHNADLFADVRITMEELMQNERPRVIIATSTLSQGVNLGVSTVIMLSASNGGAFLSKRDFWNLAGRAGRAYIDEEGKVLVAFEPNKKDSKAYNNYKKSRLVDYFDNSQLDVVTSGLLDIVMGLYKIATSTNTPFNLLLELIADNKPLPVIDEQQQIEDKMAIIDDCLLSMHEAYSSGHDNTGWIDDVFSSSLAYIQAEKRLNDEITPENVTSFLKSRVKGILKKLDKDDEWSQLVQSGLPLQNSIELNGVLKKIVDLVFKYRTSEESLSDKIELLKDIEAILSELPSFKHSPIEAERLDTIRSQWLSGTPLCDIDLTGKDELTLIQQYYSYELPWFLNGIANMIRYGELFDEEIPNVLSELALLVETGLPSKKAVKIYRSGIRSRACATEFAERMDSFILGDKLSSSAIRRNIIRLSSSWKDLSERALAWIEVLREENNRKSNHRVIPISSFGISNNENMFEIFKVRTIKGQRYFMSLDLDNIMPVKPSKRDFSQIDRLKGIYFMKTSSTGMYDMIVLNPYLVKS